MGWWREGGVHCSVMNVRDVCEGGVSWSERGGWDVVRAMRNSTDLMNNGMGWNGNMSGMGVWYRSVA